jgi:phosphate starvation-inducible protein PhoH
VYQLSNALTDNAMAHNEGPKRKTWSKHDLKHIQPLTPAQTDMCHEFAQGQHICASGYAGTGKTFLAVYLALTQLLDRNTDIDKIIIVRSAVPSRDVGFMPGSLEEKVALYELPYRDIFAEFLSHPNSYQDMKDAGLIQFNTTSFVRGLTWDNAVVIVDEAQNMNWSEIDSVITRLGENSRLIVCGDAVYQQDLRREKSGYTDAVDVMKQLDIFSVITFTEHDIVRSAFVKRWIMARTALGK